MDEDTAPRPRGSRPVGGEVTPVAIGSTIPSHRPVQVTRIGLGGEHSFAVRAPGYQDHSIPSARSVRGGEAMDDGLPRTIENSISDERERPSGAVRPRRGRQNERQGDPEEHLRARPDLRTGRELYRRRATVLTEEHLQSACEDRSPDRLRPLFLQVHRPVRSVGVKLGARPSVEGNPLMDVQLWGASRGGEPDLSRRTDEPAGREVRSQTRRTAKGNVPEDRRRHPLQDKSRAT
jgi:hypothetical protein